MASRGTLSLWQQDAQEPGLSGCFTRSLTQALRLQIGLVDMLKEEYGIEPAGMLGHSAGEIPCGYADGCLTREQTILIAYHRGRAPTCACPLCPHDALLDVAASDK